MNIGNATLGLARRLLSATLLALLALAPAAAQEKLNVGALRFVSNGGLFVAAERGYFKAEGLDVDLKFFDAAQPIAVGAAAVEQVMRASYYLDPQARLDVGDIHNQVAWLKSQGLVDAAVDPKTFLELSFIEGHMNVPKP